MTRIRQQELHARRKRKVKLSKLRARYAATTSSPEKKAILDKVGKIAPGLDRKEFLQPLEKKS
jgi:hypothetical protein